MKTLGDHLRKKRLDLGLLQKEVAQRLGIATDTVTNWEKGRTSPRLRLIPQIIEFLEYVPFSGEGKTFGQRIVEMRRALGVRQEDLAHQLSVDPSTLARWEQGMERPLEQHLENVNVFLDLTVVV